MVLNKPKKTGKSGTLSYSLVFLFIVIILYVALLFLDPDKTVDSLNASKNIFLHIIPVLVLVVFLMGITNIFLKPRKVSKYLDKESGFKGWFLSAVFGILSHSPICVVSLQRF